MALKSRPLKKPSKKFDSPIPVPEEFDSEPKLVKVIREMEAIKKARQGKPIGAKKHRWGPY
jgi:hypothetical protein